ncbi:MAG TPA: pesticidal protein Cry7Aa [Sphingobacteriaceae bacterium]|nr:pesticidal protein Cry7Aa [Sphingobacteriaceae bacterium]
MIEVKKEGIILRKTDLDFENQAVLNPAVIREGDIVHLFYRGVRNGNHSSIGYCKLNSPAKVSQRFDAPVLIPQFKYELHGVEDPRIVKIDDLYYLTYTAYNGLNSLGALATSKDLRHFDKRGLIVPQIKYDEFKRLVEYRCKLNLKYFRMNGANTFLMVKDVMFFPRRINNKLYFMQRIKPDIQLVCVNDLKELTKAFWEDYFIHFDKNIMLKPKHNHEVSYIGGGCPPIETEHGWLLIYHGVHDTVEGYVYSARVALLDINNPLNEIARLPYNLFKPEHEWELKGDVDNVVFPTGTALFGDTLYIYYGAADTRIACASLSFSSLLTELLSYAGSDKKLENKVEV